MNLMVARIVNKTNSYLSNDLKKTKLLYIDLSSLKDFGSWWLNHVSYFRFQLFKKPKLVQEIRLLATHAPKFVLNFQTHRLISTSDWYGFATYTCFRMQFVQCKTCKQRQEKLMESNLEAQTISWRVVSKVGWKLCHVKYYNLWNQIQIIIWLYGGFLK